MNNIDLCMILSMIFLTSLVFSILFLKSIIKVSIIKRLFDNPNVERKLHTLPTPNIGGVGLFFTNIFCMLLFSKYFQTPMSLNFLLAAIIVLFLLGLKDDLVGLSSSKRFYGQLFSGLILVVFGDIRLQNLTLFDLTNISYPISILVSLLFFVMITNAYNLIDGINGLLGSLTIFSCFCFSLFYFNNSEYYLLALSISVIAALFSFLFFNFGRASIFMGSSGSYIIGSLMYFNSIFFLNHSAHQDLIIPKFSLLFCILAIPFYDTCRIFILRILKKKSPFSGDSNHIHHRLLKLNISHTSVVLILLLANVSLVILNILFFKWRDLFSLSLSFLILVVYNFVLEYIIRKQSRHQITPI